MADLLEIKPVEIRRLFPWRAISLELLTTNLLLVIAVVCLWLALDRANYRIIRLKADLFTFEQGLDYGQRRLKEEGQLIDEGWERLRKERHDFLRQKGELPPEEK